MEQKEQFIRVKPETKQILTQLKIVERESFDNVINRILLQGLVESQLDIDSKLKEKLLERLQGIKTGRVISTKELRKKLYG